MTWDVDTNSVDYEFRWVDAGRDLQKPWGIVSEDHVTYHYRIREGDPLSARSRLVADSDLVRGDELDVARPHRLRTALRRDRVRGHQLPARDRPRRDRVGEDLGDEHPARPRVSEGGGMYIGAHVRASGGVWKAIDNGVELGCEAIQFFAGSPRTWKPQLYSEKDAARFREARAASPDPLRPHPHDLPDQSRDHERGLLREVGDGPRRRRDRRGAARRRRDRHPRRLAPGRRLRGRPRPRAERRCGAPSTRSATRPSASCSRTPPAPAAPWVSTSPSSRR